jgi:hypothetical protein
VALLEKRRYLNNRSGDFPQVILIVPSHVPNTSSLNKYRQRRINLDAVPVPSIPGSLSVLEF